MYCSALYCVVFYPTVLFCIVLFAMARGPISSQIQTRGGPGRATRVVLLIKSVKTGLNITMWQGADATNMINT